MRIWFRVPNIDEAFLNDSIRLKAGVYINLLITFVKLNREKNQPNNTGNMGGNLRGDFRWNGHYTYPAGK